MMHELIDQEDPRCLYCQSEVDIHLDGLPVKGNAGISFNVETLTCRSCGETFEIYSEDYPSGKTVYTSFLFSCKDICVLHDYDKKEFTIGNINLLWKNLNKDTSFDVNITVFNIDFSDKKKLYKKLKTYVTFS